MEYVGLQSRYRAAQEEGCSQQGTGDVAADAPSTMLAESGDVSLGAGAEAAGRCRPAHLARGPGNSLPAREKAQPGSKSASEQHCAHREGWTEKPRES